MPDDFQDRTEQPTDRRRAEARQQGNVARSGDLNSAGLMLAAATALALFGTPMTRSLGEMTHMFLSRPFTVSPSSEGIAALAWEIGSFLAGAVLPLMLLMASAALLVNLVQVGFVFAPEVLQPKLTRINPLSGLQRIFSLPALVRLGASLAKLLIVAVVAAWCTTLLLPDFLDLTQLQWPSSDGDAGMALRERSAPALILHSIQRSIVQLAFWMAAALVVLALLDFGFQKWRHEQQLRMTKQELRDEMKNMEGDPHIRQRRREAHRKLAQARELQRVPEADVVITNPTHIAVAVKYDPQSMAAPTVVAKGMGEIAERIRQIATEHGIPIIERKLLARALYEQVKVGRAIPLEMYEVFVEIMAYVYKLAGKTLDSNRD